MLSMHKERKGSIMLIKSLQGKKLGHSGIYGLLVNESHIDLEFSFFGKFYVSCLQPYMYLKLILGQVTCASWLLLNVLLFQYL